MGRDDDGDALHESSGAERPNKLFTSGLRKAWHVEVVQPVISYSAVFTSDVGLFAAPASHNRQLS
jgi:hypothetical protein